jgi:hypothetical protein
VRHVVCASSELWRVLGEGAYLAAVPICISPLGDIQSIYPGPDSPQPRSFIPKLRVALAQLMDATIRDDRVSWFLWRPALPLYLLLFCCAVICQRRRSLRPAATLLPCVLHTALLVLVIGHEDLRYQYPVVLVSQVFSLGFLFLPVEPAQSTDDASVPLHAD